MKSKLVVFGTGGFGREVMEALYEQNLHTAQYEILGFVDDDERKQGTQINAWQVVGNSQWLLAQTQDIQVLVCVGEPSIRKCIVERLQKNPRIQFPNFIADDVQYFKRFTTMGQGNILFCKGVFSTNVVLGDFVHVNLNCVVGHDVQLGDFATISPSATLLGNVVVEPFAYVGAGALVRQQLTIGQNTTIGMGSVVVKNMPENVVAVGSPCKVIKEK